MNKKVLVGITASYDSMATLILLKLQNFEIIALHAVMGQKKSDPAVNDTDIKCYDQTNETLLQELCSVLNVPLYFVDQKEVFGEQVVSQNVLSSFMKEFQPSCTQCHKIKVSALYQKMEQLGCDNIATGHYAKLRKSGGREDLIALYQYNDSKLDQHLLLANVDQNILSKLILPLGDLSREKVQTIVKEHLPKHFQLLSLGDKKTSCPILVNSLVSIRKNIAGSLIRKSRLCLREKNTFLHEAYDNAEFSFGESFKLGFDHKGKDQSLLVTGYNYSYQTILVSEDGCKGANYFFVQILEYFGEPSLSLPLNSKISINDEELVLDATVYFKGLNYALVILKEGMHDFVPAKSQLSIMEDTRIGRKLDFTTRIISQGYIDHNQKIGSFALAKVEDDYPH